MSACPITDNPDKCGCDEPHQFVERVDDYSMCVCGRPFEWSGHQE